jgi:hypothetical protein
MTAKQNEIPNLDKICAEIGFKIGEGIDNNTAEKFEKEITKALGILMEDGLFAYAIWLESRRKKEDDVYSEIINKSKKLLENVNLINSNNTENVDNMDLRDIMLEISGELQKTILAKQLLERMLIYARYRAKALQSD